MYHNIWKLRKSSKKMIKQGKEMLNSCHQRKEKAYSETGFVISFFLRRSWEMFESLLILVKKERIIDSALLLRSQLEMGFTLGYIFAKGLDNNENEIRAMVFHLDGNRQQLKLLNSNLEGFREFDPDIGKRQDDLKRQIRFMEEVLENKYAREDWTLPSIEERQKLSGSDVLKRAYNLSYRDLSNIEHHSMLFGEHYVNEKECEPKERIEHLKHFSQLKLPVCLYLFRAVFIEILNEFNQVYKLDMDEIIVFLRRIQEKDYKLLKD